MQLLGHNSVDATRLLPLTCHTRKALPDVSQRRAGSARAGTGTAVLVSETYSPLAHYVAGVVLVTGGVVKPDDANTEIH